MNASRPATVVRLPASRSSASTTLTAALNVVVDAIADRVAERVLDELGDHLGASRPVEPVLLDRKQLAEKLRLSCSALDRLRREDPRFPCVRITDLAVRFELQAVLDFLRARSPR